MTHYDINTQVRITLQTCRYYGATGTITEVREGAAHPYRIKGMEPWWFNARELTPAA